jgi:flavin reductase (DIM6/NTAB) family NADH-FMN oxidoreductase RutF
MAVSRYPKSYIVSIENGSQTLVNLLHSKQAVLQLLTTQQSDLIKVLGKRSGTKFNKDRYLTKKSLLGNYKGYQVLEDVAAYLLLEKIDHNMMGDHTLFSFRVKAAKSLVDTGILMFQDLIDQKMILD